ncbi:hypothetical protein [Streptomyces sp. XD-27]|uniref:hypothetical protein n=1 Tax=Streptomyces sp. XD-27 TaxID=3062779 RepID=UPI0026F4773D|nr:hypothetical protein [Streptomyces sp. XD-27]WKX73544.1 hypothetical protein Q3Y56_29890 [Streptomyces sp. XD-27]
MSVAGRRMEEAVVIPGEVVEVVELSPGSAFQLLVDASGTDGALGANRLTLGTGADGARPHYHSRSSEMFYVLDG